MRRGWLARFDGVDGSLRVSVWNSSVVRDKRNTFFRFWFESCSRSKRFRSDLDHRLRLQFQLNRGNRCVFRELHDQHQTENKNQKTKIKIRIKIKFLLSHSGRFDSFKSKRAHSLTRIHTFTYIHSRVHIHTFIHAHSRTFTHIRSFTFTHEHRHCQSEYICLP